MDDEEIDRVLFERLVREANLPYPYRTFSHGEEMIDALIRVLRGAPMPLACFIDVRMPGMSGFDVLRWIRCQRPLDEVAAVMLSSSEAPAHLNEAVHFGAQCYLAKFPTADQLAEIVRAAEHAAAVSAANAFRLPWNLLAGAPPVPS